MSSQIAISAAEELFFLSPSSRFEKKKKRHIYIYILWHIHILLLNSVSICNNYRCRLVQISHGQIYVKVLDDADPKSPAAIKFAALHLLISRLSCLSLSAIIIILKGKGARYLRTHDSVHW